MTMDMLRKGNLAKLVVNDKQMEGWGEHVIEDVMKEGEM